LLNVQLVVHIVTIGLLRFNGVREIVTVLCKNHSKHIFCTNAAFVTVRTGGTRNYHFCLQANKCSPPVRLADTCNTLFCEGRALRSQQCDGRTVHWH